MKRRAMGLLKRFAGALRPEAKPGELTLSGLLKGGYFPSEHKKPRAPDIRTSFSYQRYRAHLRFLKAHRGEIRVFADVGAALDAGAPTAVAAQKALGTQAKVFAVDIFPVPGNLRKSLGTVVPVMHSIVKGPLPLQGGVKCDAIAFRNVSLHLSQSDRRRALVNIMRSLRPGGYILGSHLDGHFILKMTGTGFQEIIL